MAKFRTQHGKQSYGAGSGWLKIFLFIGLLALLFWGLALVLDTKISGEASVLRPEENESGGTSYYLPESEEPIVLHEHYVLGYSEQHEQAAWVAYELTRQQLNRRRVKRTDDYRPDPKVISRSATPQDYKRSGYTRGHLIPAADRSFSTEAVSETFYMSNMSPQLYHFNGGIWRELEENVRDWARKFGHLYIVTGPVLKMGLREKIGDNHVSVPDAFYKVVLDHTDPERKAIAFVIPNAKSEKPLSAYAVSVDLVEQLTGIDFFAHLLPEAEEQALEKSFDTILWPVDQRRFQRRLDQWND